MAVNTTVEVVMPPMGDSVSEGSILEWHKQEGDEISEDETLVEISTDKVDAEVPAPVSGTVVKIHAAEGDTVGVGSVLAEIAPTNGSGPAITADEPEAESSDDGDAGSGTVIEIEMPADGRVGLRGHDPRVGEVARRQRRRGRDDRRDLHRQGGRGGPRARFRHADRGARRGRRHRHGRPGHRPDDDRQRCGAREGGTLTPKPEPPRPRAGRRHRDDPHARGLKVTPVAQRVAAAQGVDLAQVQGTGPQGRIGKADVLAFKENGATAAPAKPPHRRGQADPAQGRERDARALHGRVAADPDRDVLPHLHRHEPRLAPQAAQERRPPRLLHAPDRPRDRARGDRADAGDGDALRRARRQAARASTTAASTSASRSTSRRRAAGAR